MAFRSLNSPTSDSRSSSSNSTSVSPDPPLPTMASKSAVEDQDSSHSANGTPSRAPINLPRTQMAGKGGCWTCRVRRKKCDEQREGDSCKTCKRLTIKCLGWGPKRPEWMRDKRAVDEYKASIKARLTQQGLIRGQPRSNPMQGPSHGGTSRRHYPPVSVPAALPPVDYNHPQYNDYSQRLDTTPHGIMPGMPGASNPSFGHLPGAYESTLNSLEHPLFYSQPTTPSLASSASSSFHYGSESSGHEMFMFAGATSTPPNPYFETYLPGPLSTMMPLNDYETVPGQTSFQETLVMNYFEHEDIRRMQFGFAANAFKDITWKAITDDPRGAVTNSICALVDLYSTKMRIAQGLEQPNASIDQSTYLRLEALNQLQNNVTIQGWRDSDAIAALHLISFSQLSGCAVDWREPFDILSGWLNHTGLPNHENQQLAFQELGSTAQLMAKAVMWIDISSSLSLMRPPRFFTLWKTLLESPYWTDNSEMNFPLGMGSLIGCPDDALLAIAEVSDLAHWKAIRRRDGTLSFPELIHRGEAIQQRLQKNYSGSLGDVTQETLRAGLLPNENGSSVFTHDASRPLIGDIFRDAALLYLHTVLSNSSPGVPEISSAVDMIVRRLSQLPPSNTDRALALPICLAGCSTNNSNLRDILKGRFKYLDENIGNLMEIRLLMQEVWHERDVNGGVVDLREILRERRKWLLLI